MAVFIVGGKERDYVHVYYVHVKKNITRVYQHDIEIKVKCYKSITNLGKSHQHLGKESYTHLFLALLCS